MNISMSIHTSLSICTNLFSFEKFSHFSIPQSSLWKEYPVNGCQPLRSKRDKFSIYKFYKHEFLCATKSKKYKTTPMCMLKLILVLCNFNKYINYINESREKFIIAFSSLISSLLDNIFIDLFTFFKKNQIKLKTRIF